MNNGTNIGTQGFAWAVFGGEAIRTIFDLRWEIAFCIVLILADFWWGWRESKMHYIKAKEAGDDAIAKDSKFRFSKAGRRTANKIVDYLTYLVVGCLAGMAITEPLGWANHVTTSAVCLIFACAFEVSSIIGHICVIKGIDVPKLTFKSVFKFIVRLVVNFVKKKDDDLGDALDTTVKEIDGEYEKRD